MTKKLNSAGLSLIEMLVAVAIGSIMLVMVASMFQAQQKEVRSLRQKQEVIELKNLMLAQLTKTEVCSWQLKGRMIDVAASPTAAKPSETVLNLKELRQGLNNSSAIVAKSGDSLPGSSIKVKSITFKDIYPTGNPDEYKGVFEISFDESSLAYPLRPLQTQQIIKTLSGSPDRAKIIDSCGTVSASSGLGEEDLDTSESFDVYCEYRWVTSNGYNGGYASFKATLVTPEMLQWQEKDQEFTRVFRTNKRQAMGPRSGVVRGIYKVCP